jgi:hypothetical protein
MAKYIVVAVLVAAIIGGGVYYFVVKRPIPEMVDAGVPHYPGSKNVNADTFSSRLSPRDRARLVKVVILQTDDPPDKVIAFYKETLKSKTEVFERKTRGVPGAVIRTDINGKGRLIMVTVNEDANKTEISIGEITDQKPKP